MKMEKEEKMTTADPRATKETVELWNYLHAVAGKQIITGQHTQTIPCEEIAYIRQTTGKEPKLRGFELLAYSPNINYADASPECLQEVEENKGTVETALQWAKQPTDAGTKRHGLCHRRYPHLHLSTGSRLWKAETRASTPSTPISMQG